MSSNLEAKISFSKIGFQPFSAAPQSVKYKIMVFSVKTKRSSKIEICH